MRFKKGTKVEVMNKEVQKVSRRFFRPTKIYEEEDDCLPYYNDTKLQNSHVASMNNRKRSSPFCSSVLESSHKSKKVKHGSQRYVSGHSYKKSYKIGGMHLLLPKIQTRLWDNLQHPFATDKIYSFYLSVLVTNKNNCL